MTSKLTKKEIIQKLFEELAELKKSLIMPLDKTLQTFPVDRLAKIIALCYAVYYYYHLLTIDHDDRKKKEVSKK